jgi:putative hydrolase of HD superfamily
MSDFHDHILALFERIHPLDRIARAGYVLRGVAEPENVAAHSHFVAVMTLLFLDEYPDDFNRDTALTMALLHDLPEAELMDIPMPAGDRYLKEAKRNAEFAIAESMFEGFPDRYVESLRALELAKTPEAQLVRGLDKAQMMAKIVIYEKEGRGRFEEFWHNPKNFDDFGLDCVSKLFDRICDVANRTRPV